MKLAYYPGCTLKTTGKSFETSALESAKVLGLELVEPSRWNCCGTVHSLVKDDVMHHLAPIRNLLRIEQMQASGRIDEKRVVTLCAMCYNTLKRSNNVFNNNSDLARKVGENFENETSNYSGGVTVEHLLETIRSLGWSLVKDKVKKPLAGLKVAPYYGCLLLRPRGIGIDDADNPHVMEDLLTALGADVVNFPFKLKCCGSYHTVEMKEVVADLSHRILKQAEEAGAEIVATACPLCEFNLGDRQILVQKKYATFKSIPVVYFTQLTALAFGLEQATSFDENKPDPKPLLKDKGLIKGDLK